MAGAVPGIVALHGRRPRRRRRWPSCCGRSRGRRRQKPWLVAMAKVEAEAEALRAARVGDAFDRRAAVFGRQRAALSSAGSGSPPSSMSSSGRLAAQQQLVRREAGIADPPAPRRPSPARARPARRALRRQVGRGDGRVALADEHAQADLLAFAAVDVLERAEADLDALRALADIDRVGGIGARRRRAVRRALRPCRGRRRGSSMAARLGASIDDDKPTTRRPRNTSSPVKRLERNSASAPAPSLGSARSDLPGEVERGGQQARAARASRAAPARSPRPSRRAPARRRCATPSGASSPSARALDFTPTSASSSMSWMA